jgi:hypothetical protein
VTDLSAQFPLGRQTQIRLAALLLAAGLASMITGWLTLRRRPPWAGKGYRPATRRRTYRRP